MLVRYAGQGSLRASGMPGGGITGGGVRVEDDRGHGNWGQEVNGFDLERASALAPVSILAARPAPVGSIHQQRQPGVASPQATAVGFSWSQNYGNLGEGWQAGRMHGRADTRRASRCLTIEVKMAPRHARDARTMGSCTGQLQFTPPPPTGWPRSMAWTPRANSTTFGILDTELASNPLAHRTVRYPCTHARRQTCHMEAPCHGCPPNPDRCEGAIHAPSHLKGGHAIALGHCAPSPQKPPLGRVVSGSTTLTRPPCMRLPCIPGPVACHSRQAGVPAHSHMVTWSFNPGLRTSWRGSSFFWQLALGVLDPLGSHCSPDASSPPNMFTPRTAPAKESL